MESVLRNLRAARPETDPAFNRAAEIRLGRAADRLRAAGRLAAADDNAVGGWARLSLARNPLGLIPKSVVPASLEIDLGGTEGDGTMSTIALDGELRIIEAGPGFAQCRFDGSGSIAEGRDGTFESRPLSPPYEVFINYDSAAEIPLSVRIVADEENGLTLGVKWDDGPLRIAVGLWDGDVDLGESRAAPIWVANLKASDAVADPTNPVHRAAESAIAIVAAGLGDPGFADPGRARALPPGPGRRPHAGGHA